MNQYYQLRWQALATNRDTIMAALKQHAIDRVTVVYSGGGDSGDIDHLATQPAEAIALLEDSHIQYQLPTIQVIEGSSRCALEAQELGLAEALREWTLAWLHHQQGGWENDDGGSGEMIVEVAAESFALNHIAYYTEQTCYEYTL